MNRLNTHPNAAVLSKAHNRHIHDDGYYDLINGLLKRAKGVARLIACSAINKSEVSLEDITEAGYLVANDLEAALALLEGLYAAMEPVKE